MKIGIVGVGLLGGSLASALKIVYKEKVSVIAFSSPRTLEKAKQTGIYSDFYTYDDLQTNSADLDIIFLCSPIKVIASHIQTLAKALPFDKQVIVTDIGSTKAHVMSVAKEAFKDRSDICFIGGHPMTGNEFKGIDAADPLLYENSIYVITPTETTPNELIHKYIDVIKDIDAIPILMDAEKHDRVVAGISHLPQMLATGLVDLISKEESPSLSKTLSAGGFRDMTRIASSQYKMWEDIIETNKTNIKSLIDLYIEQLQLMKSAVDTNGLEEIFENARKTRDQIPKSANGLITPAFELKVRVHDAPGTLLRISTVLSENNINIKDISVQKNRELDGGHFLLTFENSSQRLNAKSLLEQQGYKISPID